MTSALSVMRIQPFHKGHQRIVDTMLSENSKVFILIGSAEKKDASNPFSYNTRKMMLTKLYWKEIKEGKLKIFPVEDINNPPKWVEHVLSKLNGEKPEKYYCGTGQDGRLFADKGFEIRSFDREEIKISATMIREKISTNDAGWKELVPEAIIPIIQEFYPKIKTKTHQKISTKGER